jgi:hypothetical protein
MSRDGSGRLSWVVQEQQLTNTHVGLWAVILVSTVADIILTLAGLGVGLEEGNPVVSAAVATFGAAAGLYLVKFLAMLWLVVGWVTLSERNASIFLALFGTVTVAASVHNYLVLFDVSIRLTVVVTGF